jgi:hypothetical protein
LTDNLLKKKLDKILFFVINLISPKKDWVRKYGEVFPKKPIENCPAFYPEIHKELGFQHQGRSMKSLNLELSTQSDSIENCQTLEA